MDVDDLNQLTEFLGDQSTLESDDEAQTAEESHDTSSRQCSAPQARIIRRRARKACIVCNKRKVRCDVLARGHTCTNCRLDGITCVIRSTKRRPKGEPSQPVPVEDDLEVSRMESTQPQMILPTESLPTVPSLLSGPVEKTASSFQTFASLPTPVAQNSLPFSESAQTSPQTDLMFAYFDFIEAEPLSHIAPEDFRFLEQKGCFHIPTRPILDDLVRQYFLHVHPVLPIIDERTFWQLYFPSGRHSTLKKIPLFVFRAMIFVSCSYASENTIRRLGFQSAVDARSCLYQRAKLLYDFDTTSDLIALSQGALILTYYSSDREPLANTSWLRSAIQYASSSNAQMYEKDLSISSEERLIRKRLWWCLILRDRILPLGVRRPIQITRENFDFSQPRLSEEDLEPEFSASQVYDRKTKRNLVRIFIAQLDLAVELTEPISYVYPVNGSQSFDLLDYNSMLSMPSKIERCKNRLDTWYTKFKEMLLYGDVSNKHKAVSLYSGLTSIYYQSARAALCQCESFMLQADSSSVHEAKMRELGSTLHSSIVSISETIQEFIQLDVAKYLPVSAIAYIALPIILNSLDLQNLSVTGARIEAKKRQLRILNEAMDLCNDRFTGAQGAQGAIRQTIESARLEQEALRIEKATSNSVVQSSPSVITDWFEVFINKPQQFLRISFSIDLSFSVGKYPDKKDLPQRLSLQNRLLPNNALPKSLMPFIDELPSENDSILKARTLERKRYSFLDYLDLGESQSSPEKEDSPWTDQTVDKILEAVCGGGDKFWE